MTFMSLSIVSDLETCPLCLTYLDQYTVNVAKTSKDRNLLYFCFVFCIFININICWRNGLYTIVERLKPLSIVSDLETCPLCLAYLDQYNLLYFCFVFCIFININICRRNGLYTILKG